MPKFICLALFSALLSGASTVAADFDLKSVATNPEFLAFANEARLPGEDGVAAAKSLILTHLKMIANAKIKNQDRFRVDPVFAELFLSHLHLAAPAILGGRFMRQARGSAAVIEALDRQQRDTWNSADQYLAPEDRTALISIFPQLLTAMIRVDSQLKGYLLFSQKLAGVPDVVHLAEQNKMSVFGVYVSLIGVATKAKLVRTGIVSEKKQVAELVKAQAVIAIASYLRQPLLLGDCRASLKR